MFWVLHYSTERKNKMQPTELSNTYIGSIWDLFNDFQGSLLLK